MENDKIKHFWFLGNLLDRFQPFYKKGDGTLVTVLNKLLERAKKGRIYVPKEFFEYVHKNFFNTYEREFKTICDLYLKIDSYERHFDYSLDVLKSILEINPNFINRLLDSHFDSLHYLSHSALLENDFRKLWGMENHIEVFTRILDYTNKFHRISDNPDTIAKIFQPDDAVQLDFLRNYLKEKTDESSILTVFNIVVSIFKNNRYEFLNLILDKGIEVETFRKLDFVVSSITYSGSIIPRYHSRIEELKGYNNYLQDKGDVKLLPYVQVISEKIDYYNRSIEFARRREFLSDWGI